MTAGTCTGFGSRLPLFDGEYLYLGNEKVGYTRDTIVPKGKLDPNSLIKTAKKYLYTPYLWGGRDSLGLDCSIDHANTLFLVTDYFG